MTIRPRALAWLAKRGVSGGRIAASKRYSPDESWTKAKAWWIQVPLAAVERESIIHLVCEADSAERGFHHLEVPASFFRQHMKQFALIGVDKINLFLAIETGKQFQDQRGPGKIRFAQFER